MRCAAWIGEYNAEPFAVSGNGRGQSGGSAADDKNIGERRSHQSLPSSEMRPTARLYRRLL